MTIAGYLLRLIRFKLVLFVVANTLIIVSSSTPLLCGLVLREFFDTLTGDAAAARNIWLLVLLLFAVNLANTVFQMAYEFVSPLFANLSRALIRINLFKGILGNPAVRNGPSPGDAINRITQDVSWFVLPIGRDKATSTLGFLVAIPLALVVMIRIDPVMTALALLPMILVPTLTWTMEERIRRYRAASREASGRVTGHLGELMGAVQAIQVAGTEDHVVDHLDALSATRRGAIVKEGVFDAAMGSMFDTVFTLSMGAVLLIGAQTMRSGDFSVGDFALFVLFLRSLPISYFPIWVGTMIADFKRAGVSMGRIRELVPNEPAENLVRPRPLYLRGEPPKTPSVPRARPDKIDLEASGLTYLHPDSRRGIEGIDLHLRQGSLTVVTGRVGAGKTTLLDTLLGILPLDAGEVLWNGNPVSEPGKFFVPPRCAYTRQVPQLFSESLRDNILLGLPEDEVDLAGAIHSAVLERDVGALTDGLDTIVGPRGVRLSGGQVQRAAAARMFVREPELMVFDDLSSAVDVENEQELWKRLALSTTGTYLVVSHRQGAFRQADNIVVLKNGRVDAEGSLDRLLEESEEMRMLWDAVPAADNS